MADGKGNVVSTTQTINSLFGARFIVPGTGMIPNNYMNTYDPRRGNALSIAPGKRVTTSMSPMMALAPTINPPEPRPWTARKRTSCSMV